MNFLAADELDGRGSATRDEHIAALYAASVFGSLGLTPGGDGHSFLERAPLPDPLPERSAQRLQPLEHTERRETWNAVALLPGSGREQDGAILLSAHLDHLGVGPAVGGDAIYNGADDDASGTAAVLALARALASGPRPRRTVIFALFGSEEIGGFGNQYFLSHPPLPLGAIAANLEFEMIGRPDPALPGGLWLTGWERSNLGPLLAAHGAPLSADPHPEKQFFRRSDNYALARRGIVAQTVSSYGLHAQYHQPDDDLAHIDFAHLERSVAAMLPALRWLASTSIRPQWNPGGQPAP